MPKRCYRKFIRHPSSCGMLGDECDSMAWIKPSFPREDVNKAAQALVAYGKMTDWNYDIYHDYSAALPIINNWRSSHSFPLNTFRTNLNRSALRICPEVITAQRIKRLSSISQKLQRFPDMKLSQMQDIGGCRAILQSVAQVNQLTEYYKKVKLNTG